MIDEKSPLSLYYQIKSNIIDNINNKIWETNTKIPAERELCELYNVSRITVRQALNELENEGYLYRKQGKGTFITGHKFVQSLSQFYSFSEEIDKMGSKSSTKIISFDLVEAEPEIAKILGISNKEKVFAIKRLRLADNEPFGVEISYIVYKYAKNLKVDNIDELGLYNAIKKDCGIEPNEAIETFEATYVDNQEAEYLQVKKKSAALHLERITYADGNLFEYCVSTIRGDKYKYTVRLGKQTTGVVNNQYGRERP